MSSEKASAVPLANHCPFCSHAWPTANTDTATPPNVISYTCKNSDCSSKGKSFTLELVTLHVAKKPEATAAQKAAQLEAQQSRAKTTP